MASTDQISFTDTVTLDSLTLSQTVVSEPLVTSTSDSSSITVLPAELVVLQDLYASFEPVKSDLPLLLASETAADVVVTAVDKGEDVLLTAKVLGTVFGVDALTSPELVGLGLYYVNTLQFSEEALMQRAIDAKLGQDASAEQVVNLLCTNVYGQAPDASTLDFYVSLIDIGFFTAASLGVAMAESKVNASQVDLVGLAQNGLTFTSYVA